MDRQDEFSTSLAQQEQESGVDTPETSQYKTIMAEREHQETRLGGHVSQSLSVDQYKKVDIYENENYANVRAASAPALAQQAEESGVDTPETSQYKTIMAEREHQETFLGGNVSQSLSVDQYKKVDIYENENYADVRTASAPALAKQAQESGVDTPETWQCKTIMAEREHQETFLGGNVRQNLSVDHDEEVDIYQNENGAAVRTASAPRFNLQVVLQSLLPKNNGQNHSEHRDEIKKYGLKWLVVYFVLAAVMTGILTGFIHSGDQKTNVLLENLKKNLTSRVDEVHDEGQKTKILLEKLKKSITSRIDKLHSKDNETALLLENLQKNLTNFITKAHGENQKTKIILENLNITLTNRIDEVHGKDNYTALLLKNLQKNLTYFINEAIAKNQQIKTNFEVLQKNLSSIMNNSLDSLNISAMHDRNDFLERQVQELKSTVLHLQNKLVFVECEDGFHYLTNCYFAIIHASEDIEFRNRNSTCGSRGGRIGNIVNLDHQKLVEYYVRPKIPAANDRIGMWLALIYNSSNKTLTTSDGNSFSSASLRWQPDYPKSGSNVILEVLKDPSTPTGAHNVRAYASHVAYGVFCEKYRLY